MLDGFLLESEKDALKKKTLAAAGELIESSSSSDSDSDADSGSAEEYSDDSDEEADEKSVHAGSEGDKGESINIGFLTRCFSLLTMTHFRQVE